MMKWLEQQTPRMQQMSETRDPSLQMLAEWSTKVDGMWRAVTALMESYQASLDIIENRVIALENLTAGVVKIQINQQLSFED